MFAERKGRTLKDRLVGTALLTGIGSALGLSSQALVARLVGVESFGIYSLALNIVGLTQVWLALDFGQAIVRFVPGYWRSGDGGRLREIRRLGLQIVTATSLVAFLMVAIVPTAWLVQFPSTEIVGLCAILATLVTLLQLDYLYLVAIGNTRQAVFLQQVLRPALVIGFVTLGWMLAIPDSYLGLGSAVIAVGIVALLAWRCVSAAVESKSDESRCSDAGLGSSPRTVWIRFSSTFLVSSAAQGLISSQSDIVLVGVMVAARESGVYAAASHLALLAGLLPNVMNSVLTPPVSAAHDAGSEDETRVALGRFSIAQMGSALAGFLAVAAIGPIFLIAYGEQYARSYPIALLLSAAGGLSSAAGAPASLVLSTMGGHRKLAIANAALAALAVALSVALIKLGGSIGAAFGTLAVAIVRSAVLQFLARRHASGMLNYRLAWRTALGVIGRIISERRGA